MYRIVQLAALSAALAAALVTVSETRSAPPSPKRFLTDRLETHVLLDSAIGAADASAAAPLACSVRGWPYRDACSSQPPTSTARNIRLITLDLVAPEVPGSTRPVYVAQR